MEGDYEWFANADLSKFSGMWVAILGKRVVASSKDAREVVKEIESKYPTAKPLIAKVSTDTLIL